MNLTVEKLQPDAPVTVWLHRTRIGAVVSQNKHSVNNPVISRNNTLIMKLISAGPEISSGLVAIDALDSGT